MELAGLEPATSWVRSLRSPGLILAWLAASRAYKSVPPNTFPNSLRPVLQYDNALLLRTSRTYLT
jgi:hypothetical protein